MHSNMLERARPVTFHELSYPLTTQLQLSGFCQHQFLCALCFSRQAGCKQGHEGIGAQWEQLSQDSTTELSMAALHAPSPTGQGQRASGKDWKLNVAGMEMQVIRLELTPCNKS